MSYSYKCPDCGSYLDPGERCDCRDDPEKRGDTHEQGNDPAV